MAPRRHRTAQRQSSCTAAGCELVDTDGPFLSVPALKRVWPQGMPALDGDAARRS